MKALLIAIGACALMNEGAYSAELTTCYAQVRTDQGALRETLGSAKIDVINLTSRGFLVVTNSLVAEDEAINFLQALPKTLKANNGGYKLPPSANVEVTIVGCKTTALQ